jgi:hypothetical protein
MGPAGWLCINGKDNIEELIFLEVVPVLLNDLRPGEIRFVLSFSIDTPPAAFKC